MAIIKGKLRPEGTNNYADVVHLETSADQIVETTDKKVMTAAERTKLNGIEAGATKDMTATEILAALKTVDTDTSGLNANTLQGKTASEFALSKDATHFATGTYTGNEVSGRTINIGFTPKWVFIIGSSMGASSMIISNNGGGACQATSSNNYSPYIDGMDVEKGQLVTNGFKIGNWYGNQSGKVYYWIAFA